MEKTTNIKGKKILVTGSTDGIGKQTASELAQMGGYILVHGKNEKKVTMTVDYIKKSCSHDNIYGYIADFSRLSEVRKLSEIIHSNHDKLDVLINNAGVFINQRTVTEDGYEATFAINHLAPFHLTNLLLDLLQKASPSRIVNVSSVAHHRANPDLLNLMTEKDYDGYSAYALSKLANILFTYELAERLKGENITANCLHPGVISTKLLKEGFGITGESISEGADTSVYLASSPDVDNITGKYFIKRKITPSSPATYDTSIRKYLWSMSEKLVGLK